MPKRSRKVQPKSKPARDANQSAFDAVQQMIARTEGTKEKNPAAVALGRLGGLKGGKARAASLTPSERRKSAIKAAMARWAIPKPKG
jgi:septal ring-binding cell division protein DamX